MGLNRTTFDRAIAAWNDGDLDGYLRLSDPGVALHGYSDRPMQIEEVRAFYEGVWAAIAQPVMTALRFVDGRCVEPHSVADMLPVLVQIGALELPG